MPPRIDDHTAPPGAVKVMLDLQQYVDTCGLEPALLELVRLRASQISGGGRDHRVESPGDQLPPARRGLSAGAIEQDVAAPGAAGMAAFRALSADPFSNVYA